MEIRQDNETKQRYYYCCGEWFSGNFKDIYVCYECGKEYVDKKICDDCGVETNKVYIECKQCGNRMTEE